MIRNIFPLSVCIALASTATAMAQASPSPAPPMGTLPSYGIAVVATIAVIGVSVMSAKRTHQD